MSTPQTAKTLRDPRLKPVEVPPPEKRICPKTTQELVAAIIQFVEMLVPSVKLYAYQRVFVARCIQSILENDGAIVTALWSRQSGKTEAVATLVLGLTILLPVLAREFPDDPRLQMFVRGFQVGIFAPIDEQAKIAFSRVRAYAHSDRCQEILTDPDLNIQIVTSRGDTLTFSNGSYFQARSASPDSQIEGKTFHLVICEESQKLSRQKVEKEIRPMLASTNGSMVKIGTAWESRGGFHTDIQRNVELHKAGGQRNHFEFPYDRVCAERRKMFEKDGNRYHLNYEKFVSGEIAKLGGTDSLEFRMNFMCLWNETRLTAVSLEDIERAKDPQREAEISTIGFQVAGLDFGKKTDRTVLTPMRVRYDIPIRGNVMGAKADAEQQVYYPKEILDWYEAEGAFEGSDGQYEMLVRYINRTGIRVIVADATGIGDVVIERLMRMLGDGVTVVPFVFSAPRKSELYKYYLQELASGRVSIPAGPHTSSTNSFRRWCHEHESLDKETRGVYTMVQALDGEHDDYPDSAALATWAERVARDVVLPEIEVSDGFFGAASGRQGAGGGNRYMRGGGILR